MTALKHVLLPTDFSRFSQPAMAWACGLAEKFDADLHVLHVMENLAERMPDFGMGFDLQPLRALWTKSHDEHELETLEKLTHVLDPQWKKGKRTTIAAKSGRPLEEIVGYAKEHEIDVIVMGTHGRTGLTHAMLGSVAENVVRLAPCPVLTVRPEGHAFEMP